MCIAYEHVYLFIVYLFIVYIVSTECNSESSKQCDMVSSTETSTAAPVGGAIPSTSTKDYLTDEELFCDEPQPSVVCTSICCI